MFVTDFPQVPERIQWHEGMLLAPQHLQSMQARADALTGWHTLAANPFAWGLKRLVLDETLLAAGHLRILALEALLDDGTLVWHDAHAADQAPLELVLDERHLPGLSDGPQTLWLTLPRGRAMRDPGQPSRFRSHTSMPVDDEVSDAAPADIPRLVPQLALALGPAPSSLFQRLRLGRLMLDGQLLRLERESAAWLALSDDDSRLLRARALASQLRAKAAFLARQTRLPSSKLDERLAQLEQRHRLQALTAALPGLEAVLQTRPCPPYNLYLALCAALGPLSTLRSGAVPLPAPGYRHDDAQTAFDAVLQALDQSAAEVSPDHRADPFTWRDGAFDLHLTPAMLKSRLVLGLRGQSERDLKRWMEGAIIGSRSRWTSLRERRVLGASRHAIDAAPDIGLASGGQYLLFDVDTSVLIPDEPLLIGNANETANAQRPAAVVLFVGAAVPSEVCPA